VLQTYNAAAEEDLVGDPGNDDENETDEFDWNHNKRREAPRIKQGIAILEFNQESVARGFGATGNNEWFVNIGFLKRKKNFRFMEMGKNSGIHSGEMRICARTKLGGI
jgi:hypothetical protein